MKNKTVGAIISALVLCVMCIGVGVGLSNMDRRNPVPAQTPDGQIWENRAHLPEHFEWSVRQQDGALIVMGLAASHRYLPRLFVDIPSDFGGTPPGMIGVQAFVSRSNIVKVNIPEPVHTIQNFAFFGNSIECLTLPSTLTGIASGAFQNNQLAHLNLPAGIRSLQSSAFAGNNLLHVYIPTIMDVFAMMAFQNNPNLVFFTSHPSPPPGWDDSWISGTTGIVHWGMRPGVILYAQHVSGAEVGNTVSIQIYNHEIVFRNHAQAGSMYRLYWNESNLIDTDGPHQINIGGFSAELYVTGITTQEMTVRITNPHNIPLRIRAIQG